MFLLFLFALTPTLTAGSPVQHFPSVSLFSTIPRGPIQTFTDSPQSIPCTRLCAQKFPAAHSSHQHSFYEQTAVLARCLCVLNCVLRGLVNIASLISNIVYNTEWVFYVAGIDPQLRALMRTENSRASELFHLLYANEVVTFAKMTWRSLSTEDLRLHTGFFTQRMNCKEERMNLFLYFELRELRRNPTLYCSGSRVILHRIVWLVY